MTKYTKRIADFFLVPYTPQENFLNDSGGSIQDFAFRDIVPYALVKNDLPIIMPERQDEGSSGVGEGRNETVVLESQYKPGAGSIPNTAIGLLMIPRLGGDVTVTHSGAEVWTIVAVAAASITTSTYFSFDVINSSGVTVKYAAWFDKNGDGTTDKPSAPDCYDPVSDSDDGINQTTSQGKRELVQIDISSATTAQQVSDAITAAITALSDVSAANGAGTSTTVTVTNGENGAVMDAHDNGSCGLTIAVSTQGYTKFEILFDANSFENQDFGFHFQRNNASYDTIYTLTGITIAEHVLEVASGEGEAGVMRENISYMVAGLNDSYGALSMLSKPRSPYGVVWNKNLSPFGNTYKNHGWYTCNGNETLTLNNSALEVTWFGWRITIENEISHNYNGGGSFANDRDFNKRNITIMIDVMPEDHELFEMSKLHWTDYGGARGAGTGHELLIQLKSIIPGTSNQVYVQLDCDKCRVIPFEEIVKADGSPERYSIDLKPAPGATITYTIQTYIPAYYFGVTA